MEGDSCCGDSEFEGADFLLSDEETVVPVSPQNNRLVSVSLSPDALDWRIWRIAEETAGLLGVPRDVAALLLGEFSWRGDALIQDWFSNREGILEKCRIPVAACSAEDASAALLGESNLPDSTEDLRAIDFECPVLATVVPFTETFALPCGHRFSNTCWVSYLKSLLEEGAVKALGARCLGDECCWPIPFSVWKKFLGNAAEKSCGAVASEGGACWLLRLLRFRRQSFVSARSSVCWCPSANCDKAVELMAPEDAAQVSAERRRWPVMFAWDGGEGRDAKGTEGASGISLSPPSSWQVQRQSAVSCGCGSVFCISCGGEPHKPLRCEVVAAWLAKSNSDGPSLSWIRTNAKECPKCRQPIEKNMGCMHMKCSLCSHEFCWLCLGAWRSHTSPSLYRCNVYEKGGAAPSAAKTGAGGSAKGSTAELQRYAHFYERFKIHNDGQQLAIAVMETQLSSASFPAMVGESTDEEDSEGEFGSKSQAASSPTDMQEEPGAAVSVASSIEVETTAALREAWTQIIECRRALKWSYAFGFFATFSSPSQQQLFEFHQGQLERGLQLLHSAASDFPVQEVRSRRRRKRLCTAPSKKPSLNDAPDVVAAAAANLAHLTSVVAEFFHKITAVIEQEIGQDAETLHSSDARGTRNSSLRTRTTVD